MPPHLLIMAANVFSMSTSSPRLNRNPCGESPGRSAGSIAATEILSAVTPGAVAFSPLCWAVSLVQNDVVEVNGDAEGSGVTVGAAAPALVAPPAANTPRLSATTTTPTTVRRAAIIVPPSRQDASERLSLGVSHDSRNPTRAP